MTYRLIDHNTGETLAIVIDMQEGLSWGDCCMCGHHRRLDHSVGYYCGPTHDEIGSVTTEFTDGGIVGGMCVCKMCHDAFYGVESQERKVTR